MQDNIWEAVVNNDSPSIKIKNKKKDEKIYSVLCLYAQHVHERFSHAY